MQQHHDDHNGWVEDAERWICRLQGVRQCKIDLETNGSVSGIHVITSADREPRHVVRDVEGLLKARLSLDVYYKKISIVQILDQDSDTPDEVPETSSHAQPVSSEPSPEPEPTAISSQDIKPASNPEPNLARPLPFPLGDMVRPAVLIEDASQARIECSGVGLMTSGATLTATVELVRDETSAQAREAGPNHPGIDLQLLARATAGALTDLIDEPVSLSVADVQEQDAAGESVVLVAVDLVEGRKSERYFGICRSHPNQQQAVVYAVLDAMNRRLDLMNFKENKDD